MIGEKATAAEAIREVEKEEATRKVRNTIIVAAALILILVDYILFYHIS